MKNTKRMNKVLLILVIMLFGYILLPATILATELEPTPTTTILGIDWVSFLLTGSSYTLTNVGTLLIMFRKTKTKIFNLGESTGVFLETLKTDLGKVQNLELSFDDFIAKQTASAEHLTDLLGDFVQGVKNEVADLKEQIAFLKEQFPAFVQFVKEIKTTELNIQQILKIGLGNISELVKNGYADQIFKVGETTDENEH